MFENGIVSGDIPATTYIASWLNAGGSFGNGAGSIKFIMWLKHIGVSREDALEIFGLTVDGKSELENSAYEYLHELNND